MGVVIFVTNCYDNSGGEGVIALRLCNRDFLQFIFSCNYIKIELKSNAFCVCRCPPLFCNIVVTLFLVSGLTQKFQKLSSCVPNKLPCDINLH